MVTCAEVQAHQLTSGLFKLRLQLQKSLLGVVPRILGQNLSAEGEGGQSVGHLAALHIFTYSVTVDSKELENLAPTCARTKRTD